ncbi:thiamine pyrophosphate-dependent dehydrogenase E1 component subunit alpha [Amycolatopsis sp. NPDC026612]|uniref:thiamine pyrophosphate-dependent dehydrogenase E1 component subunit alpha n=1 Tax=Amycolatopsis sp. NPDC026612 TaxID=3155466 RepID=UPI0033E0CEC9
MTDALRGAYRVMRTIRVFEERLRQEFTTGEFTTGELPASGHRYAGEEALATGVCLHLDARDAIAGTHRRHDHRIAKGADVKAVLAEIHGRQIGSRHPPGLANGALGGVPMLICGTALAAKQQDTGGVGVAFLGDDAANPGTTLEALHLASAWHLPVIFVAEDIGYADRVVGFGVPGVIVDGADFFAVHEVAGEAIDRARGGGGPTLLEVGFTRHRGPVGGDHDCLQRFRARVTGSGELAEQVLDDIDAEVAKLIEESVAEAKTAPKSAWYDSAADVYVSY